MYKSTHILFTGDKTCQHVWLSTHSHVSYRINLSYVSPSFAAVQFVSMYEIGEYVYTFFREDPDETTQNVSLLGKII